MIIYCFGIDCQSRYQAIIEFQTPDKKIIFLGIVKMFCFLHCDSHRIQKWVLERSASILCHKALGVFYMNLLMKLYIEPEGEKTIKRKDNNITFNNKIIYLLHLWFWNSKSTNTQQRLLSPPEYQQIFSLLYFDCLFFHFVLVCFLFVVVIFSAAIQLNHAGDEDNSIISGLAHTSDTPILVSSSQ